MRKLIFSIYAIVTGFNVHVNHMSLCKWREALFVDDNIE